MNADYLAVSFLRFQFSTSLSMELVAAIDITLLTWMKITRKEVLLGEGARPIFRN